LPELLALPGGKELAVRRHHKEVVSAWLLVQFGVWKGSVKLIEMYEKVGSSLVVMVLSEEFVFEKRASV